MRTRVVLACGNPQYEGLLQSRLEEVGIFVTACVREEAAIKNMVESTQSNLLVLSSFLIWREDQFDMRRAIIETLIAVRSAGARTILLCPDRECLIEAVQKGFTDFVLMDSHSATVDEILDVIENPISLQDAYQRLGIVSASSSLALAPPVNNQSNIGQRPLLAVQAVESKSIGFWSVKSGAGVGTFVRSVAVEVATRGYRTGLIEMDLLRPATSTALGLSHHVRNLEVWIEQNSDSELDGTFSSIQPYLLNRHLWLQQNLSASKDLIASVQALPEELYMLAPSNSLAPWKVKNHPVPDMPKHIINEMMSLGFKGILIDVPSEINYPTTISTMKEVQEVYVMLGPSCVDMVHTQRALDFLTPELGNKFKLIFNQFEDRHEDLIKGIEGMLGQKFEFIIPRCAELDLRSFDLLSGGGPEYQLKVKEFCDRIGFVDTSVPNQQKEQSRFGKGISRLTSYLSGGA